MSLAVTDTHALMWWANGDARKLGRAARTFFEKTESGAAAIYVPAFSLLEISEAMRRGVFDPSTTFAKWAKQALGTGQFIAVDLTLEVLFEAESLYAIPERGDRLIAATAKHLGYPLITRDPAVRRIRGLETIW